MNGYNPHIHHRKSIRLKGYDYAQEGLYFITICAYNKEHLFGEIEICKNEFPEMILNYAGIMASDCWLEIPKHFPNTILHEYIIMPNHIHGIIEISKKAENIACDKDFSPQFKSPSKTIGSIIRGFKIGVTKFIRYGPVRAKNLSTRPEKNISLIPIWQRDYYDIIIRNEKAYQRISAYIINNPSNWKEDKFYKKK
jgi:REP element-mobilizing transposase RayT